MEPMYISFWSRVFITLLLSNNIGKVPHEVVAFQKIVLNLELKL